MDHVMFLDAILAFKAMLALKESLKYASLNSFLHDSVKKHRGKYLSIKEFLYFLEMQKLNNTEQAH